MARVTGGGGGGGDQFGPILEVVASHGVRLRGQAWVVFRDLESANAAKRKLHDAIFFDKAIQIRCAAAHPTDRPTDRPTD